MKSLGDALKNLPKSIENLKLNLSTNNLDNH